MIWLLPTIRVLPSSITKFAKKNDKFVNQQTLKYRDNLTNLMVKIVEMDENVTLKAQLEEDVGSVILLNKFTKFD